MRKNASVLFVLAFICYGLLGFSITAGAQSGGYIKNSGNSGSISNKNTSNDYTPGCTSTSGYSSLTGEKCRVLNVDNSLPEGCTSTRGYSPLTGARCDSFVNASLPSGCVSTRGYSSTTGRSCSSGTNFLQGCTSYSGYSATTGQACDGSTFVFYPSGCTSSSGFSSTTGRSCSGSTNSPSVTVLSPNGGETLVAGRTYEIRYNARNFDTNLKAPIHIFFERYNQSGLRTGNPNYGMIPIGDTNDPSSFTWRIPADVISDIDAVVGSGDKYKVQVCLMDYCSVQNNSGTDKSDGYFNIVNSSSQSSVTVLSPNGGETWKIGSRHTISYKVTGNIRPEYQIALILEPGYIPLMTLPVATTSYSWTVPTIACEGGDACGALNPGSYKITAKLYDSEPCVGYCLSTGARLISSDSSSDDFTITN